MSTASNIVTFPNTPVPVVTDTSFFDDAAMVENIRQQYARDLTDTEFAIFLGVCRTRRLDPRQGHIHAWVFAKDNPQKRRVTHYTSVIGLRSIASRSGTYMPSDRKTEYVRCAPSKANPAGIESAVVYAKRFGLDGVYHEVVGEAFWDEHAPVIQPGTQFEGDDPEPAYLDPGTLWAKMPRLMLAKVAEAMALRRGWPEELAGFYSDDELAKSRLDDRLGQHEAIPSRPVIVDAQAHDLPEVDIRQHGADRPDAALPALAKPAVPAEPEPEPAKHYILLDLMNGQGRIEMSPERYVRLANGFIAKYGESDPARVAEFGRLNNEFASLWDHDRKSKLALGRAVEACRVRLNEQAEAASIAAADAEQLSTPNPFLSNDAEVLLSKARTISDRAKPSGPGRSRRS